MALSVSVSLTLATFFLLIFGHLHLSKFIRNEVDHLRHDLTDANKLTGSIPTSERRLTPSSDDYLPEIILYRRTKKSGSTSMVKTLRDKLTKLGYIDVNLCNPDMQWIARAAAASTVPNRYLFSNHNNLVRSDFRNKHVVIIDTIRDGYKQITSFCRHVQNVEGCGTELENCMLSNETLSQIKFRWAGREQEDDDTYIDIPLSSAHPYLSTKALRTIVPNMTIDLGERMNVLNSSCPELPSLRSIYKKYYSELDSQIYELKRRFLIVTGYPYSVHGGNKGMIIDELLKAAEAIEKHKFLSASPNSKEQSSSTASFVGLTSKYIKWTQEKDGEYSL